MTEDAYRFTVERRVTHHLMLHAFSSADVGLLNGKLGIAVTFYLLGRKTGIDVYIRVADRLLQRAVECIDKRLPWFFSSGLCGIGWGVDFLLEEGFIEGNPLEICEEIDRAVMQVNVKRLSNYGLDNGLEGLLHYVLAHTKCCRQYGSSDPFDAEFVADVCTALSAMPPGSMSYESRRLREQWSRYKEKQIVEYDFPLRQFIGPIGIREKEIGKSSRGIRKGLAGFLIKRLSL